MAQVMSPPAGGTVDLSADPRRRRTQVVVKAIVTVAALLSIVISLTIVAVLVTEGVGFLSTIALGDLFTPRGWFPRNGLFDLVTLFVGTLLTSLVAMVVAVPVGLGAAIYLAEYARPRLRRILKPILEVLAGIPSVVLGFFALSVISPSIVVRFFGASQNFNLLAAGLGVGLLVIPLVASISEDAMRSVPMSLREAAYGMGARRLATVTRVVLPAALSGLVASFIVAISRAFGETMVVFIVAGGAAGAPRTFDLLDRGTTATAAMAGLATGTDAVRGASNAFQSLFLVGLLLFIVTYGLNALAASAVRRVQQRY